MKNGFHSERKNMDRASGGQSINPERYGMTFCSNCSGSGRYFYGNRGASVCHVCAGFGLVRMERNRLHDAS